MGRAAQTLARLIDQRARRRATSELIARHPDEWASLYARQRSFAEEEARQLAAAAAEQHSSLDDLEKVLDGPVDPPRLMSGRRLPEQTVIDRIDVARCPSCIAHHDRGHRCRACGQAPQRPPGYQPASAREVRPLR
jgi:hypothetical protein